MVILIRHDVDHPFSVHLLSYLHFKFPHLNHLPFYLEAERLMTNIEKRYKIKATYFFRPKYTPPSHEMLKELENEGQFEIRIHADERPLFIQRHLLESLTKRKIYGACGHGSLIGILAPDNGHKGATLQALKKAGLEYYDGLNIKGELITVDLILRQIKGLKQQIQTAEQLKEAILAYADSTKPLKLLIHAIYLKGYGPFGGYGFNKPILKEVIDLYRFIKEQGIRTFLYHQYIRESSIKIR